MADKKRRNTPNTGNKRNNGRRKKKGRLKGLIAAELIVVVVLVMIVGHNLGLGTGITNFVNSIRKPAVEELDITGINSPYAGECSMICQSIHGQNFQQDVNIIRETAVQTMRREKHRKRKIAAGFSLFSLQTTGTYFL